MRPFPHHVESHLSVAAAVCLQVELLEQTLNRDGIEAAIFNDQNRICLRLLTLFDCLQFRVDLPVGDENVQTVAKLLGESLGLQRLLC